MDHLKALIREVPDFPKPGINFYDITTLLKHPEGLRNTADALASEIEGEHDDSVIGVEARGFIFAPALANHLTTGKCSRYQEPERTQMSVPTIHNNL